MILTWLHHLPNVVILLIVVLGVTALVVAAPVLGRRVFRANLDPEREDAAFEGFKAVVGMIGVVLAFSLVQGNANLQSVEATVGREANALTALDRVLLRLGQPDLVALRPALDELGRLIVADEWPKLADGGRSEAVDAAYNRLSMGIRRVAPADLRQQAMYTELLKGLDDLAEFREQVLQASGTALNPFFWITVAGLFVIAVVLAAMTSPKLKQRVGVAASAAAVALLLSFVLIIDRPFEGETSVSPAQIGNALDRNARRPTG